MDTSHDARATGDRGDKSPFGNLTLADALGLKDEFAPEFLAPPVDRGRILNLVEGKLRGMDRQEVSDMIKAFEPWRLALKDVLRERAEKTGVIQDLPEE